MRKIVIGIAAAVVLAFSLAACSSGTSSQASSAAQSESAASEASSASEESESSEPAADDEGQNPVMAFIGPYAAGDAQVQVEAEGTDNAVITVSWKYSDTEGSQWVMSGPFDADTLTVEYSNCTETDYVYNADGSVKSESVAFTDGTGRVVFNTGDKFSLTWEDNTVQPPVSSVYEFAA